MYWSKMYLLNEGEKSTTPAGLSSYIVPHGSTLTCDQTVKAKGGNKSAAITVNSDGN